MQGRIDQRQTFIGRNRDYWFVQSLEWIFKDIRVVLDKKFQWKACLGPQKTNESHRMSIIMSIRQMLKNKTINSTKVVHRHDMVGHSIVKQFDIKA